LAGEPMPTIYVPHAQNMWSDTAWFAIRTRVNPSTLHAAVRREMAETAKGTPIENLATLDETFDQQFAQSRFQTQLMAGFAILAVLLAVSGVYSLNADAVMQRRHEIGLRLALGASPGRVVTETIAGGLKLTLLGLSFGVAASFAAASLMRTVLSGISQINPLTLAGVAAILGAVSVVAIAIPALSASRIDPVTALREE